MTDLTRYAMTRFHARFVAFSRTQPGPLLATVQAFLQTLPASQQGSARVALRHHLGRKAVDWDEVTVARYRRNEPRLAASVLRDDQRQALLAVASAEERALIGCLYTMRRAEVAAMRWQDVDLGRGIVTIPRGKGGAAGETLLTPFAQAALAEWFRVASEPPDAAPVFPTPAGRHYVPHSLGDRVARFLERAGCWKPGDGAAHRFRRTFATEFLRSNRSDLVGLQRLMRHQNIAVTQRYIYYSPTDLSERMARVNL